VIIHCKNTLGDGTVIYKDYEVDDPVPVDDTTDEEKSDALTRYANTLTGASDPDLISAAETLITERIKED
jgi:hypothetical protein